MIDAGTEFGPGTAYGKWKAKGLLRDIFTLRFLLLRDIINIYLILVESILNSIFLS